VDAIPHRSIWGEPMSLILMSLAWKGGPAKRGDLLVYLALADHANDAGASCYPSVTTLAKKTRQTRRNIFRVLPDLKRFGWIRILEGGSPDGDNAYLLDVPKLCRAALETGDKLSSPEKAFIASALGDKLSSPEADEAPTGDKLSSRVVTLGHPNGDIRASLYKKNHQEPSREPSGVHTISPEMVSRAVCELTPLIGREVLNALDGVCRAEMRDGKNPDELRDALIASWKDYDANKPKFSCIYGAEKFFGHGMWKNKPGWPWKEGMEPKPQRVYINTAADKVRDQIAASQ
jgi:Helix-turn-helix domain